MSADSEPVTPSPGGTSAPAEDFWNSDSEPDSDDEVKVEPDELYDEDEDDEVVGEGASGEDGAAAGSVRLTCPSCFESLCTDCQRHARHKTQWRAMFVTNCVVDTTTRLTGKGAAAAAAAEAEEEDVVFPVTCESCGAAVGVQDSDEVFHFFGVIPSK